MGQLTNLYVSESYQGLIKLTDSTTGVTGNLQYLQDGLGNRLPIQMSTSSVSITGSLFGTASYATQALSASWAPDNTSTGSYVTTSSFNAYTSSNDGRVDALINATGSYATTGSNNFIGDQNIASGSYLETDGITNAGPGENIEIAPRSGANVIVNVQNSTDKFIVKSVSGGAIVEITGSLHSTDIVGTGSLFLQPNQSDARYVEIYNTSPTDTHITASGGQIFLGDDQTYVKVDNYGSVERIDVVAGNELNVSSSIVNLTGSLHQSGTFYPDVIDWFSSSIVQSTGSYILTTNISGVTEYDSYQNVASALQQYINTGSIPSGTVSGSAQIVELGFATTSSVNEKLDTGSFNSYTASIDARTGSYATTGSNVFQGLQTISGSLIVTGSITALSASITYLQTVYQTSSVVFSSGSNILGDEPSDIQTLNGVVNIPLGNLNVTGATTSSLGFFGNLQGTASYATNALSASHSVNSDTSISSSFAQTAISSSQAQNAVSASQATNSNTASYVLQAVSASYATNALSSSYSNNSTSASFAQNALSASYAPDNSNRNGLITTGSIGNTQYITGSLNVTQGITGSLFGTSSYATNALSSSHAINADTASFLLGTIASSSFATNAATASIAFDLVVYGKCDNPGGLLKGTIVRITGNSGDNALFNSASWEDDNNSANTLGMLTADVAYNAFTNIVAQGTVIGINTDGMTAGDMLYLSSSGQYTNVIPPAPYHEVRLGQVLRPQLNNGSAYISVDNGYELSELHDVDITSPVSGDLLVYRSGSYGQWVNETGAELGFATTGSNVFKGDQTISGSLVGNSINSGLIKVVTEAQNSSSLAVPFGYISASAAVSQSNLVFGVINASNGSGQLAANFTGSIVISGSNNILLSGNRTNTLVTAGTYGYIGGNSNIVQTIPTLNTASLLRPTISSNNLNATIALAFTTSSLAAPSVSTNNVLNTVTINHQSGSLSYNQNINVGPVTSTANTHTLPFLTTIQQNYFGGSALTLSHLSSSITATNNVVGGAAFTVTNLVSSSVSTTNNGLSLLNNLVVGQANGVWVSGSNPTNRRNITSNIIGGVNTAVSSSQVGAEAHLYGTIVYGQNLIVSASHALANGGSAFFGRYNDTTTLSDSQNIVFAVGTGAATGSRRTGLYVTSGSLVGVSGSLQVIGDGVFTGSLTLSGSANPELTVIGNTILTGSVQGNVLPLTVASNTASLDLNNGNFFELALTGSQNIFINPSNIKPGQTVNIKLNTTGSGTVTFPTSVKQPSGSAYTPTTSVGTDIITMVSFDTTNLFVANVKNLI